MNEILANIKSRRSIRVFLDRNIPDNVINEIIEAGRYAPSALNKQPWKFVVITNKDTIHKLSSIVKDISFKIIRFLPLLRLFNSALRDPQTAAAVRKVTTDSNDNVFYAAPLLIAIASNAKNSPHGGKDCSIACQNMMLYAHSVGIGSCFIGRADLLGLSRKAGLIMELPPGYKIEAASVFGYVPEANKQPAPERRRDNIIKWLN